MSASGLVLGRRTAPLAEQVATPAFTATQIAWQGADGSSWILTDPTASVRLLGTPRGLEWPDHERYTSTAPGMAGARYRGSQVKAREVFLPLFLRAASTFDAVTIRRAWDRSLSMDVEGVLEARIIGETRFLPCRHVRTEEVLTRDPFLAGKFLFGEYLEAAGGYWQGAPILRSWIADNPSSFFMSSGGVFYISPSNTIGAATLPNPGEVPAWPVWTIAGPCAGVNITVDGHLIEAPITLTSGQTLTIDTRPDRQTVIDSNGDDRAPNLGAVSFGQVPAGAAVPVGIVATSPSAGFSVSASLTPLYRRAW